MAGYEDKINVMPNPASTELRVAMILVLDRKVTVNTQYDDLLFQNISLYMYVCIFVCMYVCV